MDPIESGIVNYSLTEFTRSLLIRPGLSLTLSNADTHRVAVPMRFLPRVDISQKQVDETEHSRKPMGLLKIGNGFLNVITPKH